MEEITEEIFKLVKKKMNEQGVYDKNAYNQFINETVDYFFEKGKLTDDDNIELVKNRLDSMWEFVKDDMIDKVHP